MSNPYYQVQNIPSKVEFRQYILSPKQEKELNVQPQTGKCNMNKNTKEDKSETILRLAEAISKGFAKKPEESPQKILSPETKIIEKPKEIPKEISPKEIPQEKTEEPMVPEVKNSELEIYKITLKDLLKQR